MATITATASERQRGRVKTVNGIILALGVWLVLAPFLYANTNEAFWNDLLMGVLVGILAGARLSRPGASTKAASWLIAVIGAWLVIAPFVLDYVSEAATRNDVIVGALLLILGIWSATQPGNVIAGATEHEGPGVSGKARRRRGT